MSSNKKDLVIILREKRTSIFTEIKALLDDLQKFEPSPERKAIATRASNIFESMVEMTTLLEGMSNEQLNDLVEFSRISLSQEVTELSKKNQIN